MSIPAPRHLFTVEDFQRMATTGILPHDARVELIDGEIYEMAPIGWRHASVVNRLNRLLVLRLGHRAIVQIQGPVATGPRTQLQPDVLVLREVVDFYVKGPIRGADTLLAVEVADTTLDRDRAKARILAGAGVADAWIVTLQEDRLEVYRSPGESGYGDVRVLDRWDSVTLLAFPDVVLSVDEILG